MEYTREQFIELMTFGRAERPMFSELFALSDEVLEGWRAEGAAVEEIEMISFDWDYVRNMGCGADLGPLSGETASEKDPHAAEYVIRRSPLRMVTPASGDEAAAGPATEYPVRSMADWRKIKPLHEYNPDRIDWAEVASAKNARTKGALITARLPGAFETACRLMGEDDARIAFYDQPELMVDILDTLTHAALGVFQRLTDKLVPDVLFVRENLAASSGPLIAVERVSEFIVPYYRTVWRMLSSCGARLFQFEGRGNVGPLADILLDSGVNVLCPMEVAAGMDLVAARRSHGKRLAMIGGIDKEVLRIGKNAIRRELEYKMQPLMREAGTAFALDGAVPKGASLESYCYYVSLGREILGLPRRAPRKRGWQR